jgi:antitoxin Phd
MRLVKTWPVRDAKARFSGMLDACLKPGPQLVTKRGTEAAVLVPIDEWRRLHGAPARTLKELLLTDERRGELKLPRRGRHPRRPAPRFD